MEKRDQPVSTLPLGASVGQPASDTEQTTVSNGAVARSDSRTPRLAILVSDLTGPANREFVDGAVGALEDQRVASVIVPMQALGPVLCRQLLTELTDGEGWDGIVLRSHESDQGNGVDVMDWAAQLEAMAPKIPVVTVGVALKGARRIVPDVEDGVRQAVHHLVEVHGRRRFAFVRRAVAGGLNQARDLDQNDDQDLEGIAALSQAWEQVYRESLSAHGIDTDAALVVEVRDGGEGVYDAVASLLKQDPLVDAIIVSEADMAIGVCNALRAHALGIPEDTAVIVLQPGETTAHLAAPTLTTVAPLERSLGAHAALALLRVLPRSLGDDEGPSTVDDFLDWPAMPMIQDMGRSLSEVDELMPAELVLGRSCGCAPRAGSAVETLIAGAASDAEACSPMGLSGEADIRILDFAQATMGKMSLEGLASVMDAHFDEMDIEYALLTRLASVSEDVGQVLPQGGDSTVQAGEADGFRSRPVLTYVDGQTTQTEPDAQLPRAQLVPMPDMSQPLSVVLRPLVCDGQLLGLMQVGPWQGAVPHLTRSLVDSVAGLLFRESLLADAERLRRREEQARAAFEVSRGIVEEVERATDEDAALRIMVDGLSAYLSATRKVGRLGDRDELFSEGRSAGTAAEPIHSTSQIAHEAWLPVMFDAIRKGRLVTSSQADGTQTLGVPLKGSDGVTLGVLGFSAERKEDERTARLWSREQLRVVEDVVAQVGRSLETRRLVAGAQRRAARLATAAEVSRTVTAMTDLSRLLPEVVDLIRGRFELAYVGLFLLDEPREWAVLVAGTGEAGRQMVSRGHRLAVGGQSMIGACVADGRARRAADTAQAEVWRPNPLLPDIRSELALPLVSRAQVIGAMTIQDTAPAAFGDEDVTTLQTVADQLANAIENARLLEQMDQRLQELRAATGEFTQAAWRDYVRRRRSGLGFRRRVLGVSQTSEQNPEASLALDRGEAVTMPLNGHDGRQVAPASSVDQEAPGASGTMGAGTGVGVPIRLRNQVLGVLNLRFAEDHVPPETVQLIEQVADRLAVSLETARLLEVTQRTAQRERAVATLTQRMRESLEVDEVLARSAREIRDAMDLYKVSVRLAPGGEPLSPEAMMAEEAGPTAGAPTERPGPEDEA